MSHRYGPKNITLAYVRDELRKHGMSIRSQGTWPTVELRVSYGSGWPEMDTTYREETAYYTNDLKDALATGLSMAKENRP